MPAAVIFDLDGVSWPLGLASSSNREIIDLVPSVPTVAEVTPELVGPLA